MTLEKDKVSTEMKKTVLRLMDEGGIENVRARTIAKEVGVSVGTIYNFHGSLDGLIEKVCLGILQDFSSFCGKGIRDGMDGFQERILPEISNETPEVRDYMIRFLLLADIYMQYVSENENRWNGMLSFNRSRNAEDISEHYQQEQDKLFGFVSQVLQGTELSSDPDLQYHTARSLWSGVHGIVLMSFLGQINEVSRANTWKQILLLVRYFVRGLVN